MMHGHEKSDSAIVAVKSPNKTGQPAAETMERRAEAKGNASQQSTRRAQNRESVSQSAGARTEAARQRKKERFTALFHHITVELLRLAFLALKRRCRTRSGWRDVAGLRGATLSTSSRSCTRGSIGGHTDRNRLAGRTYRRPTGGKGRWRSRRGGHKAPQAVVVGDDG